MTAAVERATIDDILDRLKHLPGGLLPILHEIQGAVGYVPRESVPDIAAGLNLSRAEVHGVISFYHDFQTEPSGRSRIQLCRAEACQAVGARALERHITAQLGIGLGETTADGAVSLESVYCLGNCACGPSVRIGDEIHARVTPARFDELRGHLQAEQS
ncbi:MAG: formate dehydrogenase subunit gamma [Gammaproteobacteria bacterium]|nr:formate dehydrogenase subunit gamma [Gammaproteobacteria bacterium]